MIVTRQAGKAAPTEYTQLLVELIDGSRLMVVPLAEAEWRVVEAMSCTRPSALRELARRIERGELEAYRLDRLGGETAELISEGTVLIAARPMPARRLRGVIGGRSDVSPPPLRIVSPPPAMNPAKCGVGALVEILRNTANRGFGSDRLANLRLALREDQLREREQRYRTESDRARPLAAIHTLPVPETSPRDSGKAPEVPECLKSRERGSDTCDIDLGAFLEYVRNFCAYHHVGVTKADGLIGEEINYSESSVKQWRLAAQRAAKAQGQHPGATRHAIGR